MLLLVKFLFTKNLKVFGAKLLILPFLALNGLAANANIYKYTFSSSNYTDQGTPDVPGIISGFITIDTSLVGTNASDIAYFENGNNFREEIPNWVIAASITFTADSNQTTPLTVPSETRTLTSAQPLEDWTWNPSGTFDPTAEFVGQMSAFSLDNGASFTRSGSMIQQFGFDDGVADGNGITFKEGEFVLASPVNPVEVPGPLPFLGFGVLAYYYKKMKSGRYKL